MPRRVQGPDGVLREFPDDASDAEISQALEVAARPVPHVKGQMDDANYRRAMTSADADIERRLAGVRDALTGIGAAAGTLAAPIAGTAAGAAIGSSGYTAVREAIDPEFRKLRVGVSGALKTSRDIAIPAAFAAATDLATMGLGKVAGPVVSKFFKGRAAADEAAKSIGLGRKFWGYTEKKAANAIEKLLPKVARERLATGRLSRAAVPTEDFEIGQSIKKVLEPAAPVAPAKVLKHDALTSEQIQQLFAAQRKSLGSKNVPLGAAERILGKSVVSGGQEEISPLLQKVANTSPEQITKVAKSIDDVHELHSALLSKGPNGVAAWERFQHLYGKDILDSFGPKMLTDRQEMNVANEVFKTTPSGRQFLKSIDDVKQILGSKLLVKPGFTARLLKILHVGFATGLGHVHWYMFSRVSPELIDDAGTVMYRVMSSPKWSGTFLRGLRQVTSQASETGAVVGAAKFGNWLAQQVNENQPEPVAVSQ